MPISPGLVRLLNDYMHEECGALDSDYVFVNLWGGRVGAPPRYATVVDLVARTEPRVGFRFSCHMFRHTYATLARRGGVPVDVVSKLTGHRSVATTSAVYSHLDLEDLRGELERAGVLGRDRVGGLSGDAALRLVPAEAAGRSWVEVLRGAVRPEFRVEVYRPRPGSTLAGSGCAVRACGKTAHRRPLGLEERVWLCGGHARR